MKAPLTAIRLCEMFSYDPETGEFFYRITIPRTATAGRKTSQRPDTSGYLGIGIEGRHYRAHRLAWLYVHGEWPSHEIDHINGIKTDNRIANLRDVPRHVNSQNVRRALSTNKSGLQGVWTPGSRSKKFSSYIIANGKRYRLGAFDTAELAHAAYLAAKRELHEGCTV